MKDGSVVTNELPACAFLKVHTTKCILGVICYGTDRTVKIPITFDSANGWYTTEAERILLRKIWVPSHPDCWEIPDYEIYEINIGKYAKPDLNGGRAYVDAGDPGLSETVVLDSSTDDVFHVCQ